ncbi:N-alpha-acetyltransferase 50 [Smittium mucronatum]|uniref:N-alpha-acetyltransferase 50 n=1 Tax=Smittium mucronatum TaxID=133383 RepID=A0A1R0H0L3_9FUNG|nr:N-alpha-acetyltransferase 50 [Smittium mucronatum]
MDVAVETVSGPIKLPRVGSDNVDFLQRLNSAVFPVKYSFQFYKQILAGETIGRLAVLDPPFTASRAAMSSGSSAPECVGAIVARRQPYDFTQSYKGNFNTADSDDMYIYRSRLEFQHRCQNEMYVMTLGVLPQYRHLRIATTLLDRLISDFSQIYGIHQVSLHMQTNNSVALAFYLRYGFKIVKTVPGYYKNIDPPDAYILTLTL